MDLAIAQEASTTHHVQRKESSSSNLRKISNDSLGTESIYYLDPSEHFRPEHKTAEEYRIYTTNQVRLSSINFIN